MRPLSPSTSLIRGASFRSFILPFPVLLLPPNYRLLFIRMWLGIKQKRAKHLDGGALGIALFHKKGDRTEVGKEEVKGGEGLME